MHAWPGWLQADLDLLHPAPAPASVSGQERQDRLLAEAEAIKAAVQVRRAACRHVRVRVHGPWVHA